MSRSRKTKPTAPLTVSRCLSIPASLPEQQRAEIVDQLRDWGIRRWPGKEPWETADA